MKNKVFEQDFDPSLHVVPLDKEGQIPLMWIGEDEEDENNGSLLAITDNGRLSCFPTKYQIVYIGGEHKGYINSLQMEINDYIDNQFRKGKDAHGKKIKQYVMACVMYGDEKQMTFVYKVIGLPRKSQELEYLNSSLHSLQGATTGDESWQEVEFYLSNEPMKSWINNYIISLKEQGWSDYVRERLDEAFHI